MKKDFRKVLKVSLYIVIALVPIGFALGVGWIVTAQKNGNQTQIFWAVTTLTVINSYLTIALTNAVRKNWKKSEKINNLSDTRVAYDKASDQIRLG